MVSIKNSTKIVFRIISMVLLLSLIIQNVWIAGLEVSAYQWKGLDSFSEENLEHPLLFTGNERVYIIGGKEGTGNFSIYDIKSGEWEEKNIPNTAGMAVDKGSYGTVAADGSIYVIKDSSSSMLVIDGDGNESSQVAVNVTGRSYGALVSLGRDLYLIGGENDSNGIENSIYRYNIDSENWSNEATSAFSDKGISAFNIGGTIYIFGGSTNPESVYMWRPGMTEALKVNTTMPFSSDLSNSEKIWKATSLNGKVYFRREGNTWEYNPVSNLWRVLEFTDRLSDLTNFEVLSGEFVEDGEGFTTKGEEKDMMFYKEMVQDYQLDISVEYDGGTMIVPVKSEMDGTNNTFLKVENDEIGLYMSKTNGLSDKVELSSKERDISAGYNDYSIIVANGHIAVWENNEAVLMGYCTNLLRGYAGFGAVNSSQTLRKFHILSSDITFFQGEELIQDGMFANNSEDWVVPQSEYSIEDFMDNGRVRMDGRTKNKAYQKIGMRDFVDDMLMVSAHLEGHNFKGDAYLDYEFILHDDIVLKNTELFHIRENEAGDFSAVLNFPREELRAGIQSELAYEEGQSDRAMLDIVPGAEVAYGLRTLRSNYTGPLVRIRRDSDHETKAFYADSNDRLSLQSVTVDGEKLGDWIDGGDGYVSIWYDQSGNGRNAVQSTISSQPRIVSDGQIILDEGTDNPAMFFDGENETHLQTGSISSLDVDTQTWLVIANSHSDKDMVLARSQYEEGAHGQAANLIGFTQEDQKMNFVSYKDFGDRVNVRNSVSLDSLGSLSGRWDEDNELSITHDGDNTETMDFLESANPQGHKGINIGIDTDYSQDTNWEGNIAEFIVYSKSLSQEAMVSTQRDQMIYLGVELPQDWGDLTRYLTDVELKVNLKAQLDEQDSFAGGGNFHDEPTLISSLLYMDEIQEEFVQSLRDRDSELSRYIFEVLDVDVRESILDTNYSIEEGLIEDLNSVIIRNIDFYDPERVYNFIYEEDIQQEFIDKLEQRDDGLARYIVERLPEDIQESIYEGFNILNDDLAEALNNFVIMDSGFYNQDARYHSIYRDEINDANNFINRLFEREDDITRYVFDQFSQDIKDDIEDFVDTGDSSQNLVNEIIESINENIIKSADFYDQRLAFFELEVSDISKGFIDKLKDKEDDLSKHIRGLLTDEMRGNIDEDSISISTIGAIEGEYVDDEDFINELNYHIIENEDFHDVQLAYSLVKSGELKLGFVENLKEYDDDPMSTYIRELLTEQMRGNIDDDSISTTTIGAIEGEYVDDEDFINELNKSIIESEDFINELNESIIESLNIDTNSELKELIEIEDKNPNQIELLNRLILEEYYSEDIIANEKVFGFLESSTNEIINELIDKESKTVQEVKMLNRLILDEYYTETISKSEKLFGFLDDLIEKDQDDLSNIEIEIIDLLGNIEDSDFEFENLNRSIMEYIYPEYVNEREFVFEDLDLQNSRTISQLIEIENKRNPEVYTMNRLILEEYSEGIVQRNEFFQDLNLELDEGIQELIEDEQKSNARIYLLNRLILEHSYPDQILTHGVDDIQEGYVYFDNISVKSISPNLEWKNAGMADDIGFTGGYGWLYQFGGDKNSAFMADVRLREPSRINVLDHFLASGGEVIWPGGQAPISKVSNPNGEQRWINNGLNTLYPTMQSNENSITLDGKVLGWNNSWISNSPIRRESVNRVFAEYDGEGSKDASSWQIDWNNPLAVDYLESEGEVNKIDAINLTNWRIKREKEGLIMDVNTNKLDILTGRIIDMSERQQDVTSNESTLMLESPVGKSLMLNTYKNSGQYVDFGNLNGFNSDEEFSYMTYVTFEELVDDAVLFYAGNSSGSESVMLKIKTETSPELVFGYYKDGEMESVVQTPLDIKDPQIHGSWYHIAVTVGNNGSTKIYVDGNQVGSRNLSIPNINTQTNRFGANQNNQENFSGSFQSAKLFQKELSHEDIKDEYSDMKKYGIGTENGWLKNARGFNTVHLDKILGEPDVGTLVRSKTMVKADASQSALLRAKSTGDLRVFINGSKIDGSLDETKINLSRGINNISVISKKTEANKDWSYSLSLVLDMDKDINWGIRQDDEGEDIEDGFIRSWSVTGPFENKNDLIWLDSYYDFIGKESGRTSQDDLVKDWEQYDSQDGFVSMSEVYPQEDLEQKVFYASAEVYSDSYQEAKIYVEARDSIRVWLNGEDVVGTLDRNYGGLDSGSYFNVTLREGKNTILVKLINNFGGASFRVKLESQEIYSLYANEVGNLPSGKLSYLRDTQIDATKSDIRNTVLQLIEGNNKVVLDDYSQQYGRVGVWDYYRSDYIGYFADRGFIRKNGLDLKDWMIEKMANGTAPGSVVVMTNDYIPASILESKDENATLRRYLEAGGKVVWYGYRPMQRLQYLTGRRENWINSLDSVLGIDSQEYEINPKSVKFPIGESGSLTNLALDMGLTGEWGSRAPLESEVVDSSNIIPLAKLEDGRVSAWMKNYDTQNPYSGFIRLYDTVIQNNEEWKENILKAALYGLEEKHVYVDYSVGNNAIMGGNELASNLEDFGISLIDANDIRQVVTSLGSDMVGSSKIVFASDVLPGSLESKPILPKAADKLYLGFKDASDSANYFEIYVDGEVKKTIGSMDPGGTGRSYLLGLEDLAPNKDYDIKVKSSYISDTEIEAQQSKSSPFVKRGYTMALEKPARLEGKVSVGASGDTQINLNWDFENNDVDSFKVYRVEDDNELIGTVDADGAGSYSFTVPNLLPAGVYKFGVTSFKEAEDESEITQESNMRTVEVVTIPRAPTVNVRNSGLLRNEWSNTGARAFIQLDWDPVPGAQSYSIYFYDGYIWREVDEVLSNYWDSRQALIYPSEQELEMYADNSITENLNLFKIPGQGLDLRDTPNKLWLKSRGLLLNNDHSYRIRVRARNRVGLSGWSNEIVRTFPNRTDTHPPRGRIVVNDNRPVTIDRSVEIYLGDIYDPGQSGIESFEYRYDDFGWSQKEGWPEDGSKRKRINLRNEPGVRQIEVRVTDAAGNSQVFTGMIELVTDDMPPVIHSMNISESRRILDLQNSWTSSEGSESDSNNLIRGNYKNFAAVSDLPAEFGVELKRETTINGVKLFWGDGITNAYPSKYDIRIKTDDDQWETVKTVERAGGEVDHKVEFDAVDAKFVKVVADSIPSNRVFMRQIEVLANDTYASKVLGIEDGGSSKNTLRDIVEVKFDMYDDNTKNEDLLIRLSNDKNIWGPWRRIDETDAPDGRLYWRLSDGEGSKIVYAQVMDEVGNVSEANATILKFPSKESILTVERRGNDIGETIVDGNRYTTARTKTIKLIAYVPIEMNKMYFSWDGFNWHEEDITFVGDEELEFKEIEKKISYSGTDGWKELQLRFEDDSDEDSSANAIRMSKRMLFDTKPPNVEVETLTGSTSTRRDSIDLILSIRDGVSNQFLYSINEGQVRNVPDDEIITVSGIEKGLNVLRIRVYDQAGNSDSNIIRIWGI